MAVEIPVVVDIYSGIKEAAKNDIPRAMDELEKSMTQNALSLHFKVGDSEMVSLRNILRDNTLSAEQLATALKDVNDQIKKREAGGGFKGKGGKYSLRERGLLEAQQALQIKYNAVADAEARAAENARKLKQEEDALKRKTEETSQSTSKLSGVLSQLAAKMAATFSVATLVRFAKQIRDITGELEYQRIALRNLLQDEQFGNALFERIKSAAKESPFRIKDLVTYTKQLAAYRVESYKLFETTKRLADVSAGLGVDMNRLILAYGQVRAASVLRGQELRQFTEAGIPLVELLAEKFTELKGTVVTTADVFKLISARLVPFSMIAEIFEDMTDKGGMFYQMQEKQAKTLQGRWEKLKDTYDIALQTIGDTTTFQNYNDIILWGLNQFAKHIRIIPKALQSVIYAWAAYKVATLLAAGATTKATVAEVALTAAETKRLATIPRLTVRILGQAGAQKLLTKAMIGSRVASNALTRSFWKLTAAMLNNPIGAIAAGIAALIGLFFTFRKKVDDVDESIKSLDESIESASNTISTGTRMETLIDRYGRLAQKTKLTAKEQQSLSQTMMTLQKQFKGVNLELNNSNNSIPTQIKRLKELNKQQQEQAKALLQTAKANIELELSRLTPKQTALTGRYLQAAKDRAAYPDTPETRRQKREVKQVEKRLNEAETEMEEVNQQVNALLRRLASIDQILNPEQVVPDSDEGKKALQRLRDGINDITNAYKKYIELREYMNKPQALKNIEILFPSLQGWEPTYANMVAKLEDMLNKYKGNVDATRIIQQAIANIKFDKIKKDLNAKLKNLADEIKNAEAAKHFFQEIFEATGDENIATNLTMSVYGDVGKDLESKLREQLSAAFMLDEEKLANAGKNVAEATAAVGKAIVEDDYTFLAQYLEFITDANKDNAKQLLQARIAANAEWYKDFQKTYQKAKSYQERIDTLNAQRAARKREAESKKASAEDILAIDNFFNQRIAEVEVEALKNSDEWIKSFENLDKVGTTTLKSLISYIKDVIARTGKDLTPESLNTLVRNLEDAETALYKRNVFTEYAAGMKMYVEATKKAIAARKELNKEANPQNTKELKDAENEQRKAIERMKDSVEGLSDVFSNMGSIVSSVSDLLSLDEMSDGEAVLNGLSRGIGMVGTALALVNTILTMMELNPVVLAISAAVAVIASLASVISNLKINKADREIKRQTNLIADLEYSYNRLENAIKDAFGTEYIRQYEQELEVLAAKQAAYEAQARAERNKGKKADEDKVRDYENQARDTANQLKDMQSEVANFFTGTDLTSAAEDFASAWIDAYKEFGSTTDAMKEKFNDMIQSMIQQSLGAKIMQSILEPLFSEIDRMALDQEGLSASDVAQIAAEAPEYIARINAAMTTLMNEIAAAGLNVRQTTGQFTGISRNIASASEESITGLAAGINTQNFYMQHLDMNVAAILATLTGGASATQSGTAPEYTDPYKDQMLLYVGTLPQMRDDMASIRSMLDKVIKPNGTPSTHRVIIG